MPRLTYSESQLLALQDSPFIKRPDNLPHIEQWLDIPADQTQRRPKTSNGKTEENENPNQARRPSLFETRGMSRQSLSGEDVFLGPRMSFASASAARQKEKVANGEERQSPEEGVKFDRFGPRKEGYSKDKDAREGEDRRQKGRFGQPNGHQEDEIPSNIRPRRALNYHDKPKEQKDGGVALEGVNPPRTPGGRSKFEQPWFRDISKQETRDGEENDVKGEYRGWRERDRKHESWNREQRNERPEREPQWMQESAAEDMFDHTPDDFAKWKESMKASETKSDQPLADGSDKTQRLERPNIPPLVTGSSGPAKQIDGTFFGIFGPKHETAEAGGETPAPKTASALKKSSRFAGFFAPTQQDQSQPRAPTSPIAEPQSAPPPQTTSEDKEGFKRMMSMLRAQDNISTGPPQSQSARPPSSHIPPDWMSAASIQGQARDSGRAERQSKRHIASPDVSNVSTHPPGPVPQHPEPTSLDSQNLMKLLQPPRSSFAEAQIYGQGYHGRDSPVNSILNSFATVPQEPRSRGPPPGFPGNDQSYPRNQSVDLAAMSTHLSKVQQPPVLDERYGGPQQRPHHEHYHGMTPVELSHRPVRDVHPPPGFNNTMRNGPAPGFPAFNQGNGLSPPQPPAPHHQLGHNMRGMPSQPPPGFFTSPPPQGPPPGYLPQHMSGPSHQQQQHQQRRQQMPMGAPPGYEGFNEPPRRGPPPMQHQMQYPPQHQPQHPYLDQRGGGY